MLTVLSVAFPFAPVGPDPVGGAEQVLSTLDAHITREGNVSIVLATDGSRASGCLVTIPSHVGTIDDAARTHACAAYRRELARLLRDYRIDLVHLHGLDFESYVPETDVPVVVTLHLPPAMYTPAALSAEGLHRICVSHSQRAACPAEAVIADVINNGVALDRYQPSSHKANYVLALGRICPDKGFDLAIRAAREARVRLVLAGAVFPYDAHLRYMHDSIEPLLDADRRWIGPVTGISKRTLLAEARCVLVTSRIDETSSLVAMEALASGTPVVGFRRGALPELVEHGRTGWLVDDACELPGAIVRASGLSSAECREAARARASATNMTSRYLELYGEYARARPSRRTIPVVDTTILSRDDELASIAAEWSALCDRCPTATPFQRPEWLLAWRRQFGAGGTPRSLVLRRGRRLVGMIPLEVRDHTLRFIGAGISDYLDAVVEPGVEPTALLRHAMSGCRAIELDGLRPCSPLLALAQDGQVVPGTPSPVVSLRSRRVPARIAYDRRRIARAGKVRWETEQDDPEVLLEALFELHRARWTSRGEPGLLDAPALESFHRDAALALHARGLLRLIGLRLDERLIGVLYGFLDHGRFLFYLSGFAPDAAHLSPGRLVIARAMDRAVDEGAIELDFLRGRESYKYEWGAVDRPASIYAARLDREETHARDPLDDR